MTLKGFLAGLFVVLAFLVASTMEYEDLVAMERIKAQQSEAVVVNAW